MVSYSFSFREPNCSYNEKEVTVMVKYCSYKEVKEKEQKLYLDLKKERKEFNRFVLSVTDAEILINEWNYYIREFGVFTLFDLKPLVYDHDLSYADKKYGWTSKISMKKDFIITVSDDYINCKLNLQPYKELD